MTDFATARRNMVDCQLRPNRVSDPDLLRQFLTVPREQFLPKSLQGFAYIDEDVPLGNGRCLMEPVVLGRLLQTAALAPTDVVLEIGPAAGYATAIMAPLVSMIVGVEPDDQLRAAAETNLKAIGVDNVAIINGTLAEGHPEQAPYDLILLHQSVFTVPTALTDQLAEGGRLLTVHRGEDGVGRAVLMRRLGGSIAERPLFDANTPVLPGFERPAKFVF